MTRKGSWCSISSCSTTGVRSRATTTCGTGACSRVPCRCRGGTTKRAAMWRVARRVGVAQGPCGDDSRVVDAVRSGDSRTAVPPKRTAAFVREAVRAPTVWYRRLASRYRRGNSRQYRVRPAPLIGVRPTHHTLRRSTSNAVNNTSINRIRMAIDQFVGVAARRESLAGLQPAS